MPYTVHQNWVAIDEEWCAGGPRRPRLIGPNHCHKVAGPVWFLVESIRDDANNVVTRGIGNALRFIRTIEVRGIVVPAGGFRRGAPQPQGGPVPHGPEGDVHKGHILAIFNGGPDHEENITPQWGEWQARRQREWRSMEHIVHDGAMALFDAHNGAFAPNTPCVYYHAKVQYWERAWDENRDWAVRFHNNQHWDQHLPNHDHWIFSRSFRINAYPTTGAMSIHAANEPAPTLLNPPPPNWPGNLAEWPHNEVYQGGPAGL